MKEKEYIQPPDAAELLSTKLAPPRPRSSLVARTALLERLDEGAEHRLTLLSAPAGFGKTTLAGEWIEWRASRARDERPRSVAWVSLDAGDNDPVRFWRYIITACQTFDTAPGAPALEKLRLGRRFPLEAVLTIFINALTRLEHSHMLVLDDYHVITSLQIHETMTYFVDHLPATVRLLILTRSDPPLPLARWRAHDDLYELHTADLRFSPAETQDFLRRALPFSLSPTVIAGLETRTEGWVTGLRLFALALQGEKEPREPDHLLATFSGSQRHILEYLVADVLASQPETVQTFLLQTTFLNRLTGSLCDAVTGRNDSERILEQLERANLFLSALDDTGQWYRYHALFAEAMQHEARRGLGEDHLRSLHVKASHWYEQHGFLAEAVEVALSANDFERAAVLIERFSEHYETSDELHTMTRWIEQLPEEVFYAHPALCLAYAISLLFTLDRSAPATRQRMQKPLETAEQRWRADGNLPGVGGVLAIRSQLEWWQGMFPQALAFAQQSLELLPPQEILWRASNILMVGVADLFAGEPDAGRRTALDAIALFTASGNPFGARAALTLLAQASYQQGELHTAARFYRQQQAEAAEDPIDMSNALLGLADLAYERNELTEAEQAINQALELGKRHAAEIGYYHAETFIQVPGSLTLARVLFARDETSRAQQLLEELIILTQERQWSFQYREALALQARLSLALGDLTAVQRWSTTIAQPGKDFRLMQQEQESLITARLLIAQGEATAALALLQHWLALARTQKRERSTLEIQVLTALAHFTDKNLLLAKQTLSEALTRAQSESYQRLFLDEGEPMAMLLRALLPDLQEPTSSYARNLLQASFRTQPEPDTPPRAAATSPVTHVPPVEPLSVQEQRVLRLLAAGHSNPEIAEALVVSVNTVKTQVQSIYRKLNVRNRWEARETARSLHLL